MLEVIFFGTLITGVVAYGLWRERQDDKPGRKQAHDGSPGYPVDSGNSWFGGGDSGWSSGGDCSVSDSGGGCDGGGGGGGD